MMILKFNNLFKVKKSLFEMRDLYENCPKGLIAKAVSFESLQCAIRACAGVDTNIPSYNDACIPCEHYVVNRRQKDVQEDAKFLKQRVKFNNR